MKDIESEPLISVIVPVYKVEPYLRKCVDSILAQTYKNLEIILVDDGSPDNCPAICDEYAEKDPRVTVLHKENGGQASARNRGLDICLGDYIAFVDSDDYIEPDMYSDMLEKLIETGSDMALCGCFEFGATVKLPNNTEETVDTSGLIRSLANFRNFPHVMWNKLCTRELWCGETPLRFPEGMIFEDFYIMLDLVKRCEKAVFIPQAYYHYVYRPESTTNAVFSRKKLDFVTAAIHFYGTLRECAPEIYPVYALLSTIDALDMMQKILSDGVYFKYKKEYGELKLIARAEYAAAKPYISEKTISRGNYVEKAMKRPAWFFAKNFLRGVKTALSRSSGKYGN